MIKKAAGVVLFSCALWPGFHCAARAETKAEPLRIQLKSGSSSIALKEKLSSDEQFETVIAAGKGQWLMLEVTSKPVDAAVFTVKDPAGKETHAQYRWSDIVMQTGDYEIQVYKPADYRAAEFTLHVTLGSRPAALQYSATDKEGVALYAAMRKFINAFRYKDRAAFLSCFSRSAPYYHLNPMNIGSKQAYRYAVSYRELAADVRQKKGWYWTYLERDPEADLDAFIDHIPDGKMWTRVKGNKFVPPGDEITSSTYVKWRKEGKRWVIDEISYASA